MAAKGYLGARCSGRMGMFMGYILSVVRDEARFAIRGVLVPAIPQKPVDLRFPYVVKHYGPALFAFVFSDVP